MMCAFAIGPVVFRRHSGTPPTDPREARPDDRIGGGPGIQIPAQRQFLDSGFAPPD
jgi:hypothetical protein